MGNLASAMEADVPVGQPVTAFRSCPSKSTWAQVLGGIPYSGMIKGESSDMVCQQ